jgi:hypothetical protein
VIVCSASTLRTHPEGWGVVLAARTGLIAATIGGAALFLRILTLVD